MAKKNTDDNRTADLFQQPAPPAPPTVATRPPAVATAPRPPGWLARSDGYYEVWWRGRPEGQFLTSDQAAQVLQFLRTWA